MSRQSLKGTKTVYGVRFYPLVRWLGGPWGQQKLDVAAEVILRHQRFDDKARGGKLRLLVDRHVNRSVALPCGVLVSRDTPGEDERRDGPYLSLAVRPPDPSGEPVGGELYRPRARFSKHAQEWDFLTEHAHKALAEAGVSESASDLDKVHALAEYAMKFKKSPTYASFHPVDVLLHSSYCTGAHNVLHALANVLGIPARSICISNHSMTELYVDGRWQFADNHADGARFVPGSDYVDVTIHVDRYPQFSEMQAGYLSHRRCWARSPWHYSSMLNWHWAWGDGRGRGIRTDVMDGYGISVPCDPHHAHALYPTRDHYPFPLWNGKPEITLTEKASWLRLYANLKPGQKLLKTAYVGRTDDNPVVGARLEWWFRGEVSRRDAVLVCRGGKAVEPAAVVRGTEGVLKLRFLLDADEFAQPGDHHFVLVNRSDRVLRPVLYPTPLLEPPAVASDSELHVRPQSLVSEPIVV